MTVELARMAAEAPSIVVYTSRHARVSIEDAHLETLVLLARRAHVVERCTSARSSPSGALPCVEINGDVDGDGAFDGIAPVGEKEACYRATTGFAARCVDIDRDASADEKCAISMLNAMCAGNLSVASEYFTFVDDEGYGMAKKEDVIGGGAPWPMNRWMAYAKSRDVSRAMRANGIDAERACAKAVDAYSCLNNKLINSMAKHGEDNYWLCGDKPRSCDAAAFAQLNYHARSPACETLRTEMKRFPKVVKYINDVSERLVALEEKYRGQSGEAPPTVDASAWGDRYDAHHAERRRGWKPRAKKKEMSEKDKDMRRKAWYSVGLALGSVFSYLILGGVVQLDFGEDEDEDDQVDE